MVCMEEKSGASSGWNDEEENRRDDDKTEELFTKRIEDDRVDEDVWRENINLLGSI